MGAKLRLLRFSENPLCHLQKRSSPSVTETDHHLAQMLTESVVLVKKERSAPAARVLAGGRGFFDCLRWAPPTRSGLCGRYR